MRKTLALVFAILFAALTFAGCANTTPAATTDQAAAEETAASSTENITLTLWTGYPEFDAWLAQVSQAYMADHPNVTIECTSFDLRDEETKLSVALPAGTAADIVLIDGTWINRYVEGGYVRKAPQDVADMIADRNIFSEAVASGVVVNGDTYAIPTLQSTTAIYYNKDVFAEAGLTAADAPKSLDDVRALAEKLAKFDESGTLTRSGIALRIAGGGSGIGEKFWLWMMQEGGSIVKEVSDGKFVANYANEAGLNTLKFYVDCLYGDKTCNFDIGTDSSGFESGQTAMFVREQWVIPDIAANAPDLNYGCLPLWNANLFMCYNWYVTTSEQDTAKVAAAWDFIKYMVEPENAVLQAQMTGWFPGRSDVDLPVDQEILDAFYNPDQTLYMYPLLSCNDELQTKFAERLTTVGFASPDFYNNDEAIMAFLEECAAETNAILQENGVYGG
ncbi:MAG: extracellular solute-binding protein [Clostridiaceae bacterium]